jgi:hypothetical protein
MGVGAMPSIFFPQFSCPFLGGPRFSCPFMGVFLTHGFSSMVFYFRLRN